MSWGGGLSDNCLRRCFLDDVETPFHWKENKRMTQGEGPWVSFIEKKKKQRRKTCHTAFTILVPTLVTNPFTVSERRVDRAKVVPGS